MVTSLGTAGLLMVDNNKTLQTAETKSKRVLKENPSQTKTGKDNTRMSFGARAAGVRYLYLESGLWCQLTEAEFDRLQAYYGLAIRRNLSSVKDMQQAIWAIFLHKLSTDEKHQHGFCPSDTDTWCKFKKAELLGQTYHHKNSLPVDVVEAMRPIFRD
ncbi:uncharacterized protein TNCV_1592721 [Trichonephila clavipes]|nr:uncharacterized protein TNCV_1592721 [Trichonephila clavipes]